MEAEPPVIPPKRKRRWYQFSLRTLLIAVVVVAIPCGLLGRRIEQKRREREAVEAILKTGGRFYYPFDDGTGVPGTGSGFRQSDLSSDSWFHDLFGDVFHNPPTWVEFYDLIGRGGNLLLYDRIVPIDGRTLKYMNALPTLKAVVLSGTTVSDADLENLKALTQVEHLVLIDTGVTHAGVLELRKALPSCRIDEGKLYLK